ncbi:hypothetical protein BDV12DRAFT_200280 [Aspergillus spectabilis]
MQNYQDEVMTDVPRPVSESSASHTERWANSTPHLLPRHQPIGQTQIYIKKDVHRVPEAIISAFEDSMKNGHSLIQQGMSSGHGRMTDEAAGVAAGDTRRQFIAEFLPRCVMLSKPALTKDLLHENIRIKVLGSAIRGAMQLNRLDWMRLPPSD